MLLLHLILSNGFSGILCVKYPTVGKRENSQQIHISIAPRYYLLGPFRKGWGGGHYLQEGGTIDCG